MVLTGGGANVPTTSRPISISSRNLSLNCCSFLSQAMAIAANFMTDAADFEKGSMQAWHLQYVSLCFARHAVKIAFAANPFDMSFPLLSDSALSRGSFGSG